MHKEIAIIIIFLIIIFLVVLFVKDNEHIDEFPESSNNIIKVEDSNVYIINENINIITNLTAENNINIEAAEYTNLTGNLGSYIVDDDDLFESILEDNCIDFSIRKGFIVSGFIREAGTLDNFIRNIEKCSEVYTVFFTEDGNLVFITENIIDIDDFESCLFGDNVIE